MIHLTCGHTVNKFEDSYSVIVKAWDREYKKALSSQVICIDCLKEYSKENAVFANEKLAFEWLSKDEL